MTSTRALIRGVRPRQWSKNILVLAAPVAAGIAFQSRVVGEVGVAVVTFILASSGVYLVNDAVDVEADRAHPTKRLRPVAAGELSERAASIAALVFLGGGLAVAALLSWHMVVVVALYEAISIVYCLGLQNIPVVELVSVASGFLLRAIAGGVATGVALSPWFLVAVGFGSLFVVTGKRYSEKLLAHDSTAAIRPVLARYASSWLRFGSTLSAGALVATYALWATTFGPGEPNPWSIASILLVVLAVLRYARKIDAGDAGEPVESFLGERMLVLLVAAWTACFIGAVYL